MTRNSHFFGLLHTFWHIASHVAITVLAVGAAFSLPLAARYILFRWWPAVERDSQLLIITEVCFAAVLVLLLNLVRIAREGRLSLRMNRIVSLVHVREENSWLSRWAGRDLYRKISGSREMSVMSVTGHDTFVSKQRNLQRFIDDSYELRVMLMNPYGTGAKRRVQSLGDPALTLDAYRKEIEETIDALKSLAAGGKKVTLKFYEDPPFWNLVVMGEYVWVQYCHEGSDQKEQPEYIFALRKDKPAQGLYSPFYVHFLNQWNDARHPEYNLDSDELVYRSEKVEEAERVSYPPCEDRRATSRMIMLAH